MKKLLWGLLLIPLFLIMSACRTLQPIVTAESVDLERFMGDWYVVANIPTFLERNAWNALEQYELRDDGAIQTTFSFNRGAADGPRRTFHPVGFVQDTESNAVWGMRFVWPILAEFRILYVDEDYTRTIIGRRRRDFLWIMTRTPFPGEEVIQRMIEFAVEAGYDPEKIQLVPHSAD